MLLSEKKVWKIVTGEHPCPKAVAEHGAELTEDEKAKVTDTIRKRVQKEYNEWSERDEALQIISFTISD
jgi:hypothetical protein